MAVNAFIAEAFDKVDSLGSVLRRKRRERIELFAELREPDGDDGDAVHRRVHLLKILHGAQKLLPVIEAGAADDLAVHDDARLREAAHNVDALPGSFVAQHLAAQLGIRRLDGYVYGAYMQGDDALHLARGEVRERDIVAEEEAQARVVVLEIHGFAHTARELVNEAEHAGIRAGARLIHKIALKIEAEVAALALLHIQLILAAVRSFQADLQRLVIREELVIEHVEDLVAVDGNDSISRLHFAVQRASLIDGFYIIVLHERDPLKIWQNMA